MSQAPLTLLCIEPTFPGRLGAVADWLVRRRGYRCLFYCAHPGPRDRWPESAGNGLDVVQFGIGGVAKEPAAHWTRQLERSLCYAYGCWEVLEANRPEGIDLVLGRSDGLGSTLYAPLALPGLPVVNLLDYYYGNHGADLTGEPNEAMPPEYFHWRRSVNAIDLLALESGAKSWTTTAWQHSLYPEEYRDDFLVLHDGIDTSAFAPREPRTESPPRRLLGRVVPEDVKIVTFVADCLDRVQGFDRFAALANRLLQARSDVVCVVAGSPIVQRPLDVEFHNRDYLGHVLERTPLHDPDRVWFTNAASPRLSAEVLRASDLHVYPARAYVASHHLLEAMAAQCVIIATDEAPVREFLTHGKSGLLTGFDAQTWERQALRVLDSPQQYRVLGEAAARVVEERYARDVALPKLAEEFDRLVRENRS